MQSQYKKPWQHVNGLTYVLCVLPFTLVFLILVVVIASLLFVLVRRL